MADDDRTALFDAIETDLAGVEQALARLDAGTYFTCEVCGAPIDPVAEGDATGVRCAPCGAPETGGTHRRAPDTSAPDTSAPDTSAPDTSAPDTSAPETGSTGGEAPVD